MQKIRKVLTVILGVLMLILIAFAIVSCDDASYRETQIKENQETGEVTYVTRGVTLHVVEIDGCEYLIGRGGNGYEGYGYLSHKGNCKYCEERRRAEKY